MNELDGIRKLLESRAGDVEMAHASLERDRERLHREYEAKVVDLNEAKLRLERQVAKMESKEAQLRDEWSKFEQEKNLAVEEAEVRALQRLQRRDSSGRQAWLRREDGRRRLCALPAECCCPRAALRLPSRAY